MTTMKAHAAGAGATISLAVVGLTLYEVHMIPHIAQMPMEVLAYVDLLVGVVISYGLGYFITYRAPANELAAPVVPAP